MLVEFNGSWFRADDVSQILVDGEGVEVNAFDRFYLKEFSNEEEAKAEAARLAADINRAVELASSLESEEVVVHDVNEPKANKPVRMDSFRLLNGERLERDQVRSVGYEFDQDDDHYYVWLQANGKLNRYSRFKREIMASEMAENIGRDLFAETLELRDGSRLPLDVITATHCLYDELSRLHRVYVLTSERSYLFTQDSDQQHIQAVVDGLHQRLGIENGIPVDTRSGASES